MNQNLYSNGAVPQSNPSYPMAGLQGSTYAPPLNYNKPTEVVGGYDANINPMTGQEIPEVNFAGGGLASLVASPYRDSDVMQVKMTPREVAGLQQLAMSYGAMPEDLYDPVTGQPQFSFLKKLLPTLIGAVLPSVPGLGTLAKTVGFGNTALGTSLLVGGTTALIEGDLKKGLQAGLGAYSGANISESLRAASVAAAPGKVPAEEMAKYQQSLNDAAAKKEMLGLTDTAPLQSVPKGDSSVSYVTRPGTLSDRLSSQIANRLPPIDLSPGAGPVAPAAQPSVFGGVRSLFTSPEARTAFGQALGGGFQSPFMQQMAKTATFSGLANALTPEPKQLPTGGGAMGEDYIYIPGGFNPLYGTGRDQPYQLPGKYYKKTSQGLVPFNPFALAPGGRAAGGEIQSYADGGVVDPNRDPGGAVLLPGPQTPFSPYFTNSVSDPNVAATRAYVEDLNRRAKNPPTYAYPGMGGTGLGGTNRPYVPEPSTGGGEGGGGGGSLTGSPVGDLLVGIGAQEGIRAGLPYLRDKFATDERAEIGNKPVEVTRVPATDIAPAVGAVVPSLVPFDSSLRGVDPYGFQDLETGEYQAPGTDLPSVAPAVAAVLPSLAPAAKTAQMVIEAVPGGAEIVGAAPPVTTGGVGAAAGTSGTSTGIFGLEKGAPLTGKAAIIPGLQTVLGLHQAYEGIRKGNEVQSALGGFGAATGIASLAGYSGLAALGPIGLAAAAVAALGSSMVNTKEFGDKALENYWKAVDQGRGFGQAPPEELAQGFVNFYRTNKNEFPGQAKYGRTGNEDFVYDMTQVINDAVKSGKVDKGADATTIFEKAVQPWLDSMGSGPQNADARRVQDFMMTDLIHNFMQGKPISNAQVKGDKKFKIVSERPVFAGTASASAPSSVNPFREPRELAPVPTPYSPRIIEEEPASPMPPAAAKIAAPAMTPFSEPEREYIQPIMTPFSEVESEETPRLRGRGDRQGAGTARFNYGGAVGEDYNFGFARGGMPNEYQAGGKLLDGPGDGMSDDIPAVIRGKGVQRAALADGEFVIPADVVSHLGNGSTKAGAKKLYDMMARVRQARTGKTKQAPAVKTARLLPA